MTEINKATLPSSSDVTPTPPTKAQAKKLSKAERKAKARAAIMEATAKEIQRTILDD
jgi:hypothetical protein